MMSKSVFRTFKRHYHKVAKVYSSLSKKGTFKLTIGFENNTLRSQNTIPDETETVRFVVLMERFLNPHSPVYFRTIWNLMLEQFTEEITGKVIEDVENAIERLNKGYFAIKINDDNLTAEKIYRTLADGEYFARFEDARNYLISLKETPIVGPLFWHQFYDYNLQGYALISGLFDIILMIEKTEKYGALYSDVILTAKRCIYCLDTAGGFESEEHIFPEALGNDELVLPKGYVCENCNHGILAELDEYFLNFEPIAFLQVYFVQYTKPGKLPKANFQNVRFEKTHPLHIKITAKDKSGNPKNIRSLGDGWQSFNLQMRGKTFNPKQVARALFKFGLGMVALEKGMEYACDSRYDLARGFIVDDKDFPNNLLMRTVCQPQPQVRIAGYQDILSGTPFEMNIYGLVFLLNIEPEPYMTLTDELKQHDFVSHPLC